MNVEFNDTRVIITHNGQRLDLSPREAVQLDGDLHSLAGEIRRQRARQEELAARRRFKWGMLLLVLLLLFCAALTSIPQLSTGF